MHLTYICRSKNDVTVLLDNNEKFVQTSKEATFLIAGLKIESLFKQNENSVKNSTKRTLNSFLHPKLLLESRSDMSKELISKTTLENERRR